MIYEIYFDGKLIRKIESDVLIHCPDKYIFWKITNHLDGRIITPTTETIAIVPVTYMIIQDVSV